MARLAQLDAVGARCQRTAPRTVTFVFLIDIDVGVGIAGDGVVSEVAFQSCVDAQSVVVGDGYRLLENMVKRLYDFQQVLAAAQLQRVQRQCAMVGAVDKHPGVGAGVGAFYFQPSEHRSHIHVDGCFLCRHRHRTHLGVVVFALDAILVFSEWLEA